MNVEIKSPLELPIMKASAFNEEEIEYKGLDIKIYNIKIEKDPFGEPNVITLSMLIDNQTDKTFSVFDMALLNDLKNIYYPSPFGNTDFWFNRVNPGDKVTTKLSFSVNNPRRKHWLVIYDNYNRQPLIKMSLNNAKRNINNEKTVKRKHNKQDNKNDFYIPSQND